MNRLLLIVMLLIVGGAVIGGLLVVGGPGQARMEVRDRERLSDLRRLGEHERCKAIAEAGGVSERCQIVSDIGDLRDPLTEEPYVVRAPDDATFEVCAELESDPKKLINSRLQIDGQTACLRYRKQTGNEWIAE